MDSISINVSYSNLLKETFLQYSAYNNHHLSSTIQQDYQKNTNSELLTNLLIAIMGADRPVKQINLYNNVSGSFGTGIHSGYTNQNVADQDWYAQTLENAGSKYIPLPHKNMLLSRQIGLDKDKLYLSLCRQFYNTYNQPEGFVEVLQYYDIVFATAINVESNYQPRIILYNNQGQLIYPFNGDDSLFYDYLPSKNTDMIQLKNPISGRKEYVMFSDLEYSGFSAAVVVDSHEFFAPIMQFLSIMLIALVIVVLFCYIMAYYVTRRLSAPIVSIHSHLNTLDFDSYRWEQLPMESSDILEIDTLHDAINQFQLQLKKSTDNIILLQKQDMQSQMLALQSQMNPHFLYNFLATISAMAEESMTSKISEMSAIITDILRYISSNKQQLVPLEDELDNTYNYLRCLGLRFGDSLKYNIDVPDEMLDILVPKLCIQLLVENSVKFTTPMAPPWEITITGVEDENLWSVAVKDNGSGFSPESITRLKKIMAQIDHSKLLPSLELDGMGILNIYLRLHLLFGEGHFFDFGNLAPQGAIVAIGGKIND
ncbi:MAG TPA: histidine kinase [Epulopiscium sp.]|nr:histidine kinase [Candidatus Epulonipiscium sp.]